MAPAAPVPVPQFRAGRDGLTSADHLCPSIARQGRRSVTGERTRRRRSTIDAGLATDEGAARQIQAKFIFLHRSQASRTYCGKHDLPVVSKMKQNRLKIASDLVVSIKKETDHMFRLNKSSLNGWKIQPPDVCDQTQGTPEFIAAFRSSATD